VKRAKSQLGEIRLVVFGRGSSEAETPLLRELEGSGVEVSVLGLLSPEEVAHELALADALLFVRGGVSSRRGSALAGLACELPVVGYRSEETGFPVTEGGVVFVALRDREALGEALTQVLANDDWRRQLRQRSRIAQEQHFSWEVISQSFLRLLNQGAVR
jgi:glycosyltransferase involved in cell wall biosynthesis